MEVVQLPGSPVQDSNLRLQLEYLASQTTVPARFLESPVTAVPGQGQDGQVITYTADATNGVNWLLRYRAASSSSYKWEFIGGAPLFAEVMPDEGTASATYVALTTAGPAITLPLAGDYSVEIGTTCYSITNANNAIMSYDIGATAADDNDAANLQQPAANAVIASVARSRRKTGLSAVTLTAKYRRATAGTAQFSKRWMRVTPVRVG